MNINQPFITPKEPQVLRKKINLNIDCYSYFYFTSYSEFNLLKDGKCEFIDKFTINFCQLSKNLCRNLFSPYNGYSIIVKNLNNHYYTELNNHDGVGLDIIINPQGIGIGSIILNHLIFWAKEKYPAASIPKIQLSSVDEEEFNNKRRRNRLYEKIGLLGNAKMISDLNPTIEKRGFEIFPAHDFIREFLLENQSLSSSY